MDNAALVAPNPGSIAASPIQSRFSRLSPRGRALLAVGAAALIALVSAAWLWSSSPSYRILFTNLSDQDGGAIIAQLTQMNIPQTMTVSCKQIAPRNDSAQFSWLLVT